MLEQFQSYLSPWLVFFAEDPALRLLQCSLLLLGFIVIFLVFFATRDILLRTHSFWYMAFSIVLVALLPVVGFLLYLLLRPARTIKERELEALLLQLLTEQQSSVRRQPDDIKGGIVKKPKKKSAKQEDISL